MKAALVVTGSEILTGRRRDALIMPFTARFTAAGFVMHEVRVLSDDAGRLSSTVLELLDQVDLLVVTGGLGLTPDDTTHAAVDAVKALRSPRSEGFIMNPVGSARGIDIRFDDARLVFLPGVPRESLAMIPLVMEDGSPGTASTVEVPAFGLREVEIAGQLGPLAHRCGYLPRDMEIALVVPRDLEDRVRATLGIHALEDRDLATTFGALLRERGLTCAAAESCTGGLIGHLITQVPGSSDYFLGSVVSYGNEVKADLLGVNREDLERYGAVSEQVARAMLKGVLGLTGADVGMATTGIAGPGGGTQEKPVGTVWICVGSRDDAEARRFRFSFDRDGNKMISAKAALFMLRNRIHDQDIHRHRHP